MKRIYTEDGIIFKTFCGVCQKHLAVKVYFGDLKEAIQKAQEELAIQTIHDNHKNNL